MLLLWAILGFAAFDDWVKLKQFDFSLKENLIFSTNRNPVKTAIYPKIDCILRKDVARAVSRVSTLLKLQGYTLVILDCYRPSDLQKHFIGINKWPHCLGGSLSPHNRGNSVDVTLFSGEEDLLGVINNFNTLKPLNPDRKQKKIFRMLKKSMKKEGFIQREVLWHYEYGNYPPENVPFREFGNG